MRASIHLFPRTLRTAKRLTLACACLAGAGFARGEVYTPPAFSHYQPILDRMPFGALPANFSATPAETLKNEAQVKAEQQTLAKKVNMSAVNVTPEGATAIGFTDLSVNPPVNYYLRVGAAADGWTVVNADYDAETATIEKDGVSITLKLGQGLVDPASLPAKAAAPARPLQPAADATLRAPAAPTGLVRSPRLHGTEPRTLPRPAGMIPPQHTAAATLDTRSYAERQRERAAQKTQEQMAAEAQQRAQLEKLAREAAANEIKRREAEALQQDTQTEEPAAQPDAQGQVQ